MTKLSVTLALTTMILALATAAAKAHASCPLLNATLHGSYIVAGSGTIAGVGPVTAVGKHTWDGDGKTAATNTISANGNILNVHVTGMYTVNIDCTGKLTESDGSHYNFVVQPNGESLSWIETDAGTIVSGTELRLKNVDGDD